MAEEWLAQEEEWSDCSYFRFNTAGKDDMNTLAEISLFRMA